MGDAGNSFALMKDAGTNGYYISINSKAAGQKVAGYEVNKSLATDIDKAELFAFAPKSFHPTVCGRVKLCTLMITKKRVREEVFGRAGRRDHDG